MIHPNAEIRVNNGTIVVDDSAQVREGVLLDICSDGGKIEIRQGAVIGKRTVIGAGKSVIIGEHVMMAPSIYICDTDHAYEDITKPIIAQGLIPAKPLKIDDNSWIGIHAVIMASVGKGCVIGANSVLTKDTGDYEVWVGSPAKCIKKYNLTTKLWEKV